MYTDVLIVNFKRFNIKFYKIDTKHEETNRFTDGIWPFVSASSSEIEVDFAGLVKLRYLNFNPYNSYDSTNVQLIYIYIRRYNNFGTK